METPFEIAGFLVAHRASVLAGADAEVVGRRLPHYEAAGAEETSKRLADLFDVVVVAASEAHLDPALAHADHIAAQRQQSGHDLSELQTAINALEEQLWHAVMEEAPAEAQGHALGVVSTILGAIKDRLACAYVSRAAGKPTHTLRLDELFRGTASGQP
ncbi:MAG: hypothetical protein Q7V88_13460 [Actinomycetota bacterium]|nr:hypothetical protein [Actinomycetota bacterium]